MKVGFIGAGNMGGAIAQAVSRSSAEAEIYIADCCEEKARALALSLGGVYAANDEVVQKCDYVFLGVKPQVLRGVLEKLPAMGHAPVFISMAAGVTIATITACLPDDARVIRIMPNMPVSVGAGMILYDCSSTVSQVEERTFLQLMESGGVLDKLPEALIDAGCAVSGCGPAFAFLFAEALADGGVACGLPREKARLYAAQMLYGAADFLLKDGRLPGDLKDAVCSPGGSTICGVLALEENGFRGAVMDAVLAAYKRTKALG